MTFKDNSLFGCFLVTVPSRPVIAATVSTPNMANEPVTFTNTTTGASGFRWDFGDGSPASTEVSPTHVYSTGSKKAYYATLTVQYGTGCEENLTLAVPVRAFELPNVLTPNNDGLNDTFHPTVSNEPVNIQIFNRWGRKVYEKDNCAEGWPGASVPAGTYYYHLTNASGESWKGWIDVVK